MSGSLPPFTNPIAEHLSTVSSQSSASSGPRSQRPETQFDPLSSRRGPRPTAEPAANPKRQKNREAQRAHRERKERYVKDLEYDAARLRQYSVETTRERDAVIEQRNALAHENQQLRAVIASLQPYLRQNAVVPEVPPPVFTTQSFHEQSSRSGYTATMVPATDQLSLDPFSRVDRSFTSEESSESAFTNAGTGTLDYDAIALDFVLGLERPCMEHIQYLVSRANNTTGQILQRPPQVPDDGENEEISGHALMASCPPPSPLKPFVHNVTDYQLPGIERADLGKLLGLSDSLPGVGDDELPPIKAWVKLREDQRFPRLSAEDFQEIQRQLMQSVQCHRFGSVLTAADLDRAMHNVCSAASRRPSGTSSS